MKFGCGGITIAVRQLIAVVEQLDHLHNPNTPLPRDTYTIVEQYINGIIDKDTAVTTIMEMHLIVRKSFIRME